jgi:hypothetical protein
VLTCYSFQGAPMKRNHSPPEAGNHFFVNGVTTSSIVAAAAHPMAPDSSKPSTGTGAKH